MNNLIFAFLASFSFFVPLSPANCETVLERVIEKTKNNVVRVVGYSPDGSRSIGSGCLLRGQFVVTAKHVLRGCTRAFCEFDNGERIEAVEELQNVDDQSVLILGKKPKIDSVVNVASSDPGSGELVIFAGFDHGSRLRYYDATIGTAGKFNNGGVSEANAAAISGNSGGAAFNSDGLFFGTLWGTDGRSTSLVSNRSTMKFFNHVAERFPSFGSCFDSTPRTKLVPIRQPTTPVQPNNQIQELQNEIKRLRALPTPEQWFAQNRDQFKFQIVLRDKNGKEIDRDTVNAIGGEINLQFFEK